MAKEKGISTVIGIIIIVVFSAVVFGGVFAYKYFLTTETSNQAQIQSEQKNQNQQAENVPVNQTNATIAGTYDCQNFSGAWMQDCILRATTADAILKKDASLCQALDNSAAIDYCYSGVAVGLNDVRICELIKDKSIKKMGENAPYDECYKNIAEKLNDETLCSYIKGDYRASSCYKAISKKKGDISICEKIKGRDNVDFSYYDSCLGYIDQSCSYESDRCDKMMGIGSKNECYKACAKSKKDSVICEKISLPVNYLNRTTDDIKDMENSTKNMCYSMVATAKKDASLCLKIVPSKYGSPTEKEDCIKYINQIINK